MVDLIEKPKRKFRAMTEFEVCVRTKYGHKCPLYDDYICTESKDLICDLNIINRQKQRNTPYKTKDGKYILIEVKNEKSTD